MRRIISTILVTVMTFSLLGGITVSAATKQEITNMQNNLKSLGISPGTVDGLWGNNTKTAAETLSKQNGESKTFSNADTAYSYVKAYVVKIQNMQNKLGFKCGTADGIYGTNTKNAVLSFQKTYAHLAKDGIAGPKTREMFVFGGDRYGDPMQIRSNCNIRSGPGTTYSIVGTALTNSVYALYNSPDDPSGYTRGNDGYIWYRIWYGNGTKLVGAYIREDLIKRVSI